MAVAGSHYASMRRACQRNHGPAWGPFGSHGSHRGVLPYKSTLFFVLDEAGLKNGYHEPHGYQLAEESRRSGGIDRRSMDTNGCVIGGPRLDLKWTSRERDLRHTLMHPGCKSLKCLGRGMVDLVGFEPTTSSMPWPQRQSLTGNLTRNKGLLRGRFGPHLDPTCSPVVVWTSKGPYLAQSGSGHAVCER